MSDTSMEVRNFALIIEYKILKGTQYYINGTYCGESLEIAQAIMDNRPVHSIRQNS